MWPICPAEVCETFYAEWVLLQAETSEVRPIRFYDVINSFCPELSSFEVELSEEPPLALRELLCTLAPQGCITYIFLSITQVDSLQVVHCA